MKKILLSCACCLLAVGLLAGCDEDVEDVNPDEPDTTVPSTGGDDGGSGAGGDGSESVKEPEPELAPRFLEVDELVDGESYYLGFPYSGTYTTEYYLFNGTTDNYGDYLQCSVYGTGSFEPTKVKVSINEADSSDPESVETIGLTFTALKDEEETEYTIYAWPSANSGGTTQYGEITFIETSLLKDDTYGSDEEDDETDDSEEEDTTSGPKEGAVTEFTWDAERGTLNVKLSNGDWYFETYESKSSISLASTDKTYAASHFYVDNPDYEAPKIVEPDLEKDTSYKLGAFEPDSYSYKYFNGSRVSSSYLATTDVYSEAVDVYATEQPYDGIEDSYTLSFVSGTDLKYISNNGSSTNVSLSDDPCLWVWDEELEVFARVVGGRSLVLYTNNGSSSIRAYAQTEDNLANPHVTLISEDPGTITRPAVTSVVVTTAAGETSGTVKEQRYLQLSAAIEPEYALTEVTWTSSDTTKATVSEDGLVTGVAATEEGSPVTITATSVSTPSVSGSIQITVEKLVYEESETIVAASVYPDIESGYSQSLDGTSIYGDLVTISFAKNGGNNAPTYYGNGADFRIYALNTVTFTPVDETIAKISSIVFTYSESYYGNSTATLKDANGTDAGTITKNETDHTVTLIVTASGAVTYTNEHTSNSGGTQLRITQIVINYTDPTADNGS